MSRATQHREIEFKFRVGSELSIDLSQILRSADLHVSAMDSRSMAATYFDTPRLSLIRSGITMRHRIGGGDDGWHLKLPAEGSTDGTSRDEIHVDASTDAIPVEFASICAPLVRRQEMVPMAIVRTARQPFEVHAEDGSALLEVVDDHVTVAPADDPSDPRAFHEIEVELLRDDPAARAAAQAITNALITAGAEPSSVSKAAQAFGSAAAEPPDVPALPFPAATAPAIDALQAIFAGYVRDLIAADIGIRRGTADSVHRMRVACRRLRSSLQAFAEVLDAEAVSFLREELRWLASELGEVRDIEVQRERLCALTDDETLRSTIEAYLDGRQRAATSGAMAALRSDRHDFLLEDLILLVSEPPVREGAFDPAGTVLRQALTKPWQRLRTAVGKAERSSEAAAWHRVRIKAKQVRYAAEATAPILGTSVAALARSLAKATDTLGQRQDAHVSSLMLAQIAHDSPGETAFGLGILAARNEASGDEDTRTFSKSWPATVAIARTIGLD